MIIKACDKLEALQFDDGLTIKQLLSPSSHEPSNKAKISGSISISSLLLPLQVQVDDMGPL
jgi:hypothetical protein